MEVDVESDEVTRDSTIKIRPFRYYRRKEEDYVTVVLESSL